MSTPRDDDALSWGGDDDPTLDVGEKRPPERPGVTEPGSLDAGPEPLQPEPLQPEPVSPQPVSAPAPAPAPAGEPTQRATSTARHPGADATSDEPDSEPQHSEPLGNAGLVGIGMVAATFVLFAVGWLVAGLRLRGLGLPIPDVTVLSLTIAAALAPLVWFVAVLALTRRRRTWQRFLLLILGILLLVPWPFLSLGAFA